MTLLLMLRLTRLRNLAGLGARRRPHGARRPAYGGKRAGATLLTVIMALVMTYSFSSLARDSVRNMRCQLGQAGQLSAAGVSACGADGRGDRAPPRTVSDAGPLAPTPAAVMAGLTMQLTLMLLVSVLAPLGARELARPDWDLEWLVTLPLGRAALLSGRLLERSVVNPAGLLALLPLCMVLAWDGGLRWSAPLVAGAAAMALLSLSALLRTLVDTGLRLSLAPSRLRNLQAVISLLSLPPMLLGISLGTSGGARYGMELARAFPHWTLWTPPGLVVQMLDAAQPRQSVALAGLLALQVCATLGAGVWLLGRQLRHGVVANGVRESGRGARPRPAAGPDRWHQHSLSMLGWTIGSVTQRRELTLLARDRNFLVQSLLLPLLIVGGQLIVTGKFGGTSDSAITFATLAAMAFGIGAYMLMLSAFQTLHAEGDALWLLYTFPAPIAQVLMEKAQLWALLALVYPLALLGFGVFEARAPDWPMATALIMVVVGVPMFALIAVSLGVFACDPQAQEGRGKPRPAYLYLYTSLSGMYIYAIATGSWLQKLALLVLLASLALALWQTARDALPYLLDPAAAPPSRVGAADGLMAIVLFFGVQLLLMANVEHAGVPSGLGRHVLAFVVAGALTCGVVRLIYWRKKTIGVPAIWHAPILGTRAAAAKSELAARSVLARTALTRGETISASLMLGCGAALAGVLYIMLSRHLGWQAMPTAAWESGRAERWLLFGLSVVAAPLVEEFLFRGLLLGGLRRSMGAAPAILLSAAVFAIVHPGHALPPVFILGVAAGYAYERYRILLAPMLVHASFNALLLGYQLWMLSPGNTS
ncbi:MAG: CPBP family intramembrane glutamic endopeptidase [Pseudomonadota bacterium]